MRTMFLLLSLFLAAASAPGLNAAASPTAGAEVWTVQFDTGGIAELHLLCAGGRVVAGFALETDRNTPWFAATPKLTLSPEGRLKGTLTLTPGPDLVAQLTPRGKKKAKPPAAEVLSLDLAAKGGRVTGKISTAK